MIMGRNAGLWVALVQAGLNLAAAVLIVVTGHPLTVDEVALLATANVFGAAVVAIVANESDPTTVPTFAPTLQERRGSGPDPAAAQAAYSGPERRDGGEG